MKLYIQIENGQTKNHPAFEDNLIQAFGSVPNDWEPFVRVNKPILSPDQTLESNDPVYEKVDNVWTDIWVIRNMTEEEKIAQQSEAVS